MWCCQSFHVYSFNIEDNGVSETVLKDCKHWSGARWAVSTFLSDHNAGVLSTFCMQKLVDLFESCII